MQLTKKSIIGKIIAIVITLSLIGACFVMEGSGTDVSDYRSQISNLEEKQAELKREIAALQTDINKQTELKEALESQISTLQAEIDIYNVAISDLNVRIEKNEKELSELNEKLAKTKDNFLKQIKALYLAGSSSLSILLSADDYGDFLYQFEFYNKITQSNDETMEIMKNDIKNLNDINSRVLSEKGEQEALKGELEAKNNELTASANELNSIIYSLQTKQNELSVEAEQYEAAISSLEVELQAAIAEAAARSYSYSGYSGGGDAAYRTSSDIQVLIDGGNGFVNPLGSYGYIVTSPFGYRDDVGEGHTSHAGMDLAGGGIYGQPIYAAADGEVIISGYNTGGYGYYVVINHGNWADGNNYSTLYGHCSALAVSEGQYVSAGQIIAYVGSTGYSTGAHLHFEIRVNGNPVNPRSYMSL